MKCDQDYVEVSVPWTSDRMVTGKTVKLLGVRVLSCPCGLSPQIPALESLVDQIQEIAYPRQVWQWRASPKAWSLRGPW